MQKSQLSPDSNGTVITADTIDTYDSDLFNLNVNQTQESKILIVEPSESSTEEVAADLTPIKTKGNNDIENSMQNFLSHDSQM